MPTSTSEPYDLAVVGAGSGGPRRAPSPPPSAACRVALLDAGAAAGRPVLPAARARPRRRRRPAGPAPRPGPPAPTLRRPPAQPGDVSHLTDHHVWAVDRGGPACGAVHALARGRRQRRAAVAGAGPDACCWRPAAYEKVAAVPRLDPARRGHRGRRAGHAQGRPGPARPRGRGRRHAARCCSPVAARRPPPARGSPAVLEAIRLPRARPPRPRARRQPGKLAEAAGTRRRSAAPPGAGAHRQRGRRGARRRPGGGRHRRRGSTPTAARCPARRRRLACDALAVGPRPARRRPSSPPTRLRDSPGSTGHAVRRGRQQRTDVPGVWAAGEADGHRRRGPRARRGRHRRPLDRGTPARHRARPGAWAPRPPGP